MARPFGVNRENVHDHQKAVDQQVEFTAAIREAVGDEVDILVECHGRYDPEWVIQLAERIAPYKPFFIEDPIRHENPEAMSLVREKVHLPLAAGERYHNKWEFREIIRNNYVNYIRPDVGQPLAILCWIDVQLSLLDDVIQLYGIGVFGSCFEVDEEVRNERPVLDRLVDDCAGEFPTRDDGEGSAAARERHREETHRTQQARCERPASLREFHRALLSQVVPRTSGSGVATPCRSSRRRAEVSDRVLGRGCHR